MRYEEQQGCPKSTFHSTLSHIRIRIHIRIGHRCMRYANWIRWAKFMHRRVCCPQKETALELQQLKTAWETEAPNVEGGQEATVRYLALCVVAFRTQHNMQQCGRQAAATGNWEIYALFCLAKHATSILVNFSCTAGPGYIRVVPCTDTLHPCRNGHSRFDAGLPLLPQAKCKTKQNKRKANSGVPKIGIVCAQLLIKPVQGFKTSEKQS